MNKICNNCGNPYGPFSSLRLFNSSVWYCTSTKATPLRVTECVERRDKTDSRKYKELLHPYDAA